MPTCRYTIATPRIQHNNSTIFFQNCGRLTDTTGDQNHLFPKLWAANGHHGGYQREVGPESSCFIRKSSSTSEGISLLLVAFWRVLGKNSIAVAFIPQPPMFSTRYWRSSNTTQETGPAPRSSMSYFHAHLFFRISRNSTHGPPTSACRYPSTNP